MRYAADALAHEEVVFIGKGYGRPFGQLGIDLDSSADDFA
jgi:hypothetical protein